MTQIRKVRRGDYTALTDDVCYLIYGLDGGCTGPNFGMDCLKKLHIKFCKMILKVNKSTCTTTAMVLGDLGRLPIEYNVNSRMLGFWYKLICGSDNKLSCIFYRLIY